MTRPPDGRHAPRRVPRSFDDLPLHQILADFVVVYGETGHRDDADDDAVAG